MPYSDRISSFDRSVATRFGLKIVRAQKDSAFKRHKVQKAPLIKEQRVRQRTGAPFTTCGLTGNQYGQIVRPQRGL
jgi:hypothetical protein